MIARPPDRGADKPSAMADDPLQQAFAQAERVAAYCEGPRRFVPGLDALLQMTTQLVAEHVGDDARILVLGAGGGSELQAMAAAQPRWRFVGVDPSRAMLDLAAQTAGDFMDRITMVEGLIDDAPAGPFDAATCLLTLHFLEPAERLRTLLALHDRLKPGAPFVAAHSAFPQEEAERGIWLDRYARFAIGAGFDADMAWNARAAVAASLNTLEPAHDEAILRAAGFRDVSLFYAAFTWRGWICGA